MVHVRITVPKEEGKRGMERFDRQQQTEGRRETKAKTEGKRKGEPSDWKRGSLEQNKRKLSQKAPYLRQAGKEKRVLVGTRLLAEKQ